MMSKLSLVFLAIAMVNLQGILGCSPPPPTTTTTTTTTTTSRPAYKLKHPMAIHTNPLFAAVMKKNKANKGRSVGNNLGKTRTIPI